MICTACGSEMRPRFWGWLCVRCGCWNYKPTKKDLSALSPRKAMSLTRRIVFKGVSRGVIKMPLHPKMDKGTLNDAGSLRGFTDQMLEPSSPTGPGVHCTKASIKIQSLNSASPMRCESMGLSVPEHQQSRSAPTVRAVRPIVGT